MIREEYESPIKQPLRRVKGKLKIDLSKSDKKMKNVIYEFLFDPTDQKEDRIHHPGFTSTTLQQRMSAHQSVLNAPQSLAFQNVSLYKEVSRRPDQVFVRRFNIEALLKKGIPLPMLERAFMQFFKERGEKVRNIGAGGKGSVSKDAQNP